MGKRLVWFGLGVVLATVVAVKGKELYQRFTPKSVAGKIGTARSDAFTRFAEFRRTMTESMSEREAELREATGLNG